MMEFKALNVLNLTEEVAGKLEVQFENLPGIQQFEITLQTRELHVIFDETQLPFQSLAQTLATVGCPLRNITAALVRSIKPPATTP